MGGLPRRATAAQPAGLLRRVGRGVVGVVWPASPLARLRRLLALTMLALLAAGADPQVQAEQAVLEWIAVIDVTQSMAVADMPRRDASGRERRERRLDAAQRLLTEALRGLPCGSRLGLAVFTAHRSILLMEPVEVCDNYAELSASIARIDFRMGWQGNSEIAKGLDSALLLTRDLPGGPAVAFFTDGQEAPPISARYRPPLHVEKGQARALLVGVGGDEALPIPKVDLNGQVAGTWAAGEVMQQDLRSLGRDGSPGGQTYVDGPGAAAGGANGAAIGTGSGAAEQKAAAVAAAPGATPGREHLSALREGYLRLLAEELGLDYLRLRDPGGLAAALSRSGFAQRQPAPLHLRMPLTLLALALLLAAYRPWAGLRKPAAPAAMRPQR
jgi:mxaL protein